MIKINKLIFFFFRLQYFLKEIENMFSLFLSSYRKTRESLAELEKAVGTAFPVLPNFHSCFYNSIETQYIFSFLIINNNSYTFILFVFTIFVHRLNWIQINSSNIFCIVLVTLTGMLLLWVFNPLTFKSEIVTELLNWVINDCYLLISTLPSNLVLRMLLHITTLDYIYQLTSNFSSYIFFFILWSWQWLFIFVHQ